MSTHAPWTPEEDACIMACATRREAHRALRHRSASGVDNRWRKLGKARHNRPGAGRPGSQIRAWRPEGGARPPRTEDERRVARVLTALKRQCQADAIHPSATRVLEALRAVWGEVRTWEVP